MTRQARRHLQRRAVAGAADRRDPGPDPGRLLRRRGPAAGGERSPTPTRRSDLPMLEAVGFPVAVNPETRLAAIARKRGWLVEHWSKAPGGPRPLLPIGPMLVERSAERRSRQVRPMNGAGRSTASSARVRRGAVWPARWRPATGGRRSGRCELVRRATRRTCPGPDWVRLRPRLAGHLRQRPGD